MTGRPDLNQDVMDQAVAWYTALEQDDADWDGYIVWLESDDRHRDAFDAVSLVMATVDHHQDEISHLLETQTPSKPSGRRFGRVFAYAGGSIAAAITLLIAVPLIHSPESVRTYSTERGGSRSIDLGNGVRVVLSPASDIAVRGKKADQVELSRGEAFFDVRHDPSRSFKVTAGGYSISDIGTRFSVNLAGSTFRAGVSEGSITVAAPNSEKAIQVSAGNQLMGGTRGYTLSPVAPADVGSWRAGKLSYSDAPLSLVLGDIARYSNRRVAVDPTLENTHFSGTLVIGDGSRLVEDLASVIGARLNVEKDGVSLSTAAAR